MTDTLLFIRTFLESTKLDFEIMDCDPDLADTNIFCKNTVSTLKMQQIQLW